MAESGPYLFLEIKVTMSLQGLQVAGVVSSSPMESRGKVEKGFAPVSPQNRSKLIPE